MRALFNSNRLRIGLEILIVLALFVLLARYPKDRSFKFANVITYENSLTQEKETNNVAVSQNERTNKKLRLLCLVFTTRKRVLEKSDRIRVINRTWSTKCDKFFFVTKISNETLKEGKIHNEPVPLFEPRNQKDDTYGKLTDRLYYTYMDIFKMFPDYDFYYKCDDDTYTFIDNMRTFLSTKNPRDPVTFGYDFRVIVEYGYPSGGAGFILSHEAMRRLTNRLNENYTSCVNTGVDDVDVNKCLRLVHVYMSNTLDEVGRERFHPLSMAAFVHGDFPGWLREYASNPLKKGIDCCSNTSISYHYTTPEEMQTTYDMWEKGKKDGLSADQNIQNIMKVIGKVDKLK